MNATECEFKKQKTLEDFKERQERRISIERQTTSQRDCDMWKTARRGLVTASIFGRVCCSRSSQSYTNIVKTIMYTNLQNIKEIQLGVAHQANAIKALETLEGIVVEESGFFIDQKYSFLGATPDGLIGDHAIAEVKCPMSIFDEDIDNAILSGKCTIWSKGRKDKKNGNKVLKILGINKNHKWYYQVQG